MGGEARCARPSETTAGLLSALARGRVADGPGTLRAHHLGGRTRIGEAARLVAAASISVRGRGVSGVVDRAGTSRQVHHELGVTPVTRWQVSGAS